MSGTFDPDGLEGVELGTVLYLRERSGISLEGPELKGTGVDVSMLRAGDCVVLITPADLIADQECASAAAFRRPGRIPGSRPGG